MSEQSTCRPEDLREAVSIHTRKVTDSCRDKDCIEDLRVYLTRESQALLDASAGAKARCAELVYAYIDVEPVAFNRNHYCIDIIALNISGSSMSCTSGDGACPVS